MSKRIQMHYYGIWTRPMLRRIDSRYCPNSNFVSAFCISEAWRQENHPKCAIPNHEVVTETAWYGEQELLGRHCGHKFCPIGSKCAEGRWLAHCCRPIIKAANS
ncbi:Protein CBG23325 [Caenorhabditis briggsae]|uniref:Protein CBG23325 n=1 Tax=Caenorhabditis briggsae TaxID=6238 RepID=A8Y468_CAEBR|nr:Protein CBG23325 [Caenorhabditis briggsae]CAP39688.2 Protein CBG23325 [Caenorhabditis briggsae]